jgi:cysteine synthase A
MAQRAVSTRLRANLAEAVGNTPLVELNRIVKGLPGRVLVKMESMNPLGSVKDRIGIAMVEDAEKRGLIQPGKTILVEPTSGNTGIALAFVAAAKGYRLILAMPDTMSAERRKMLSVLGAELVLTPGAEGMKAAIAKAQELLEANPDAHMLQQFKNPANPDVHRRTTGPEIWADSGENVDFFVSAVGTGGTISGAGGYLKEKNPRLKVIAVEPAESPVITQTRAGQPVKPGPHKIQGIGTGFIPDTLDMSVIDEVMTVSNEEAFTMGRRLPKEEGILAGISSGANVHAAVLLASKPENKGKTIVTVVCSTGERYLSTMLFESQV